MAINTFTGATSANWGTATNWSQGTVPTASDGHVTTFDGASPACTQNVSSGVCNAIDFTNYTNTITMNNGITVSGAITLGAGMTAAGASTLIINTSANITTNGYVWPLSFQFSGTSQTYTLQDDFYISGTATLAATTALTINNNGAAKVLYLGGNVSIGSSGCAGTAKVVLNGTGSLAATAALQNNFEINTAGTITIGTNFRYSTNTFTYTAGTVNTTTNNSTFTIGLSLVTTTTLATNGIDWNNVAFVSAQTTTLSNPLTSTGAFSNTANVVLNGSTLYIKGSASFGGAATLTGTTALEFTGASPSWITGTGSNRLNTTINSSGTMTLSGANGFGTNTLTYTAGTISAATSTLTIVASCTLSLGSGNTWGGWSLTAAGTTATFTSDVHFAGNFSHTGNGSNYTGAYNFYVGGGFTWGNSTNSGGSNTMSFILDGTGTWSGVGVCSNNVTINTAGTITIGTSITYRTGTLTYTAGTVTTTSSTLIIQGDATYNTNGITWNNINLSTSSTLTLNSTFTCTGTATISTNQTFIGTAGFTFATLVCTTVNRSITLKAGNTYTITTSMSCIGTGISNSFNVRVLSNTASSYAYLNLQSGATCYNKFCVATDIDSSGGRLVTNVKGTYTRSINWYITNPDNYYFF